MSVRTPTSKDYDYTLIQSGADTRPFDASFDIAELNIGPKDTIVFSQSLSAVAAAIMQQESNKDSAGKSTVAQTMVSGILNYLEYRFTKVQLKLFGRVPDNVSGEIGVMFVPPGLKVTQANFTDLFNARAADKAFPGTKRISLASLCPQAHKGKWLTIEGEFQKGGRPIGLSEVTRDGVVGKIVIGMLSDALSGTNTVYVANSTNSQPASSTDQSVHAVKVAGDLCLLNMHVEGHWIFTAPGQVPDAGSISALEIVNNENFDPVRVYTGFGLTDSSYVGAPVTGQTPAIVADAVLNAIAQEKIRGGPPLSTNAVISLDDKSIGYTFLEDSAGTIGNFFTSTTVKSIANTVVEGVSEFFPPLIRQLVVWGGRTMIGVIDRLVNTQDGMLAKEQNMTADNNITTYNGAWPGSPNLGQALTPCATHFTPGRNTFNGIPLSPAVQLIANKLGSAAEGSVNRNIFNMLTWALSNGIYPFHGTATTLPSAVLNLLPYINQDAMEVFIRDVGGAATWIPTLLTPAAGATDDYYAGVPLFFNASREGTIQPGYVRSDNSLTLGSSYQSRMGPTQLMIRKHPATPSPTNGKSDVLLVPAFLEFDMFARVLAPSDGWHDGSLNALIATLIAGGADVYAISHAVASFLGHEVSIRDGRWIGFSHKFTYAARAAWNVDAWDPEYPLPTVVNDSGYCTMQVEIDADAPVTIAYLGATMVEHMASVIGPDGKYYTRNITNDNSMWEDNEGALFWIEPAMCYSV